MAATLPLNSFAFVDDERSIEFTLVDRQGPPQQSAPGATWQCTLDTCRRQERTGGRGGRGASISLQSPNCAAAQTRAWCSRSAKRISARS